MSTLATELEEAVAQYRDSLAAVQEALAAHPENEELQEMHKELVESLDLAASALEELASTPELPQGKHQLQQHPTDPPPDPTPRQPTPTAPQPQAHAPRTAPTANNARIHPNSLWASTEPDFAALGQLYPALQAHLQPPAAPGGRAHLDFTQPAACRELTRVLLHHDLGIEWDVPEGQLVPPVTNRANYIHWLQDLLLLSAPAGITPQRIMGPGLTGTDGGPVSRGNVGQQAAAAAGCSGEGGGHSGSAVVGLDIGCGANLIYPLLGAALCGWRFVGVDVTPVALEWAARNRASNPQLAALIEVRPGAMQPQQRAFFEGKGGQRSKHEQQHHQKKKRSAERQGEPLPGDTQAAAAPAASTAPATSARLEAAHEAAGSASGTSLRCSPAETQGGGILSSALRPGERFAFCMCNPPFFGSLAEAGRNPATAYGGSPEEMVFPGGEGAFVAALAEDSATIRDRVHWFTTMVGKKATLKALRTALYRAGVKVVRTTEFFQGKTSRWGLAWSFVADADAANRPLQRPPALGGAAAAGSGAPGSAAGAAPVAVRKVGRKVSWQVAALAASAHALLAAAQQALQQCGLTCTALPAAFKLRAHSDCSGAPAGKRPKHDGADVAQVQWGCEVEVFMLHGSYCMLTVALDRAAPQSALAAFAAATGTVEAAICSRWKVLT